MVSHLVSTRYGIFLSLNSRSLGLILHFLFLVAYSISRYPPSIALVTDDGRKGLYILSSAC